MGKASSVGIASSIDMPLTGRADNGGRRSPVARVLLAVLNFYRTGISPIRPASCRFVPSCSAYAAEAVALHGAGRGSWLALRRLLRCHPLHAGGHDPVPSRVHSGATASSAVPAPPTSFRPAA